VLRSIQHEYGGGSITEPQRALPDQTGACHAELSKFFSEWFDTAYPATSTTKPGATEPGITGPRLHGHGFTGNNA
jgi:hypothetical protein